MYFRSLALAISSRTFRIEIHQKELLPIFDRTKSCCYRAPLGIFECVPTGSSCSAGISRAFHVHDCQCHEEYINHTNGSIARQVDLFLRNMKFTPINVLAFMSSISVVLAQVPIDGPPFINCQPPIYAPDGTPYAPEVSEDHQNKNLKLICHS
ncbi:hypothetical protein FRC02_011643 [Tulasnella sp. 418]|nr:hypothetical protein FRC02_011643 [Tulasnella sp. 418]